MFFSRLKNKITGHKPDASKTESSSKPKESSEKSEEPRPKAHARPHGGQRGEHRGGGTRGPRHESRDGNRQDGRRPDGRPQAQGQRHAQPQRHDRPKQDRPFQPRTQRPQLQQDDGWNTPATEETTQTPAPAPREPNRAMETVDIAFSTLNLAPAIHENLKNAGYERPTPIQARAIPIVLEGRDLLGIAQTGTGKTAAFCLPILTLLSQKQTRREPKHARTLILTPTRELAIQIHQNLETYGRNLRLKTAVIFGGVGQGNQVRDLAQGVDVLVATPGRLLDLIEQRYLKLDKVEIFVLDEADRMLDMGFMRDIRRILPLLPAHRHNLFFSATMPPEIETLAHTILKNPASVEITPPATTVARIKQSVMFVDKKDKLDLLVHLLKSHELEKTLVFVEMKHVANKVAEKLEKNGISSAAIHGNKSQGARQRAIQDFTHDRVKVLVATDIASRGIDIDGITHVINYELSNLAESYVHRIGRTARAGADGDAISLVTGEEKSYLAEVERATKQKIPVITDHPYHSDSAANAAVISASKAKALIEGARKQARPPRGGGRGGGGGGGRRHGGGGRGHGRSHAR